MIIPREKIIKKFLEKNTNPNVKEKDLGWRLDGRLEWICYHGCGHTVYAPPVKQTNGKMFENWVHGCCGCCDMIGRVTHSELK